MGVFITGRDVVRQVRGILDKARTASVEDVVALIGEPPVRPVPSRPRLRLLLANTADPGLYAAAFPSGQALHLTAGLEIGPWEILLEDDLHQVRHQSFDIVVIERLRTSPLGPRVTSDLAMVLCGLVPPNGLFVAPTSLREPLLASQNLQLMKSFAAHDVFRRLPRRGKSIQLPKH